MENNQKAIPITEEILSQIYEKRVLLFVEQNDDNFYQLVLTRPQFKVLMKFICIFFPNRTDPQTGIIEAELSLGKKIKGDVFKGFETTI